MNDTLLLRLATEAPLIVALIWYSVQMQKNFAQTLDKRQAMVDHLAEVVAANTAAMQSVATCLNAHDARTMPAVADIDKVLIHAEYIRGKLDQHHEYVVQKHERAPRG